jgi:hypothetical protein
VPEGVPAADQPERGPGRYRGTVRILDIGTRSRAMRKCGMFRCFTCYRPKVTAAKSSKYNYLHIILSEVVRTTS